MSRAGSRASGSGVDDEAAEDSDSDSRPESPPDPKVLPPAPPLAYLYDQVRLCVFCTQVRGIGAAMTVAVWHHPATSPSVLCPSALRCSLLMMTTTTAVAASVAVGAVVVA